MQGWEGQRCVSEFIGISVVASEEGTRGGRMFQRSCAIREADIAEGEEIWSMVSCHKFDRINKDLGDQSSEHEDTEESEDSSGEEMDSAFSTCCQDSLSWF